MFAFHFLAHRRCSCECYLCNVDTVLLWSQTYFNFALLFMQNVLIALYSANDATFTYVYYTKWGQTTSDLCTHCRIQMGYGPWPLNFRRNFVSQKQTLRQKWPTPQAVQKAFSFRVASLLNRALDSGLHYSALCPDPTIDSHSAPTMCPPPAIFIDRGDLEFVWNCMKQTGILDLDGRYVEIRSFDTNIYTTENVQIQCTDLK